MFQYIKYGEVGIRAYGGAPALGARVTGRQLLPRALPHSARSCFLDLS